MTSRYEAYIDGTSLSSLDSSILVLDIQPGDIAPQYRSVRRAKRPGMIITDSYIDKASVNILFEIHKYSTSARLEVCQKVQKWANGAVLKTNDRPTQQLNVVCESYPAPNAKNWTEPLTVAFAGYNPPYWEDITATTVNVTTTSQTVSVPGNAPETLVSAVASVQASATTITFTVDGKSITVNNLETDSGDTITLGYDDGILYIRQGTVSILDHVTTSSADVLKTRCGADNTFAISSDGVVTCAYTLRGCWY